MNMKQKLLRVSASALILCLVLLCVGATASAAGMLSGKNQAVTLSDPVQTQSVSDPGLAAKGFTLSFEDEILVNLYYTVSDPSHVTEHGMLVFYEAPETVDPASADAVYDSTGDGGIYLATTDGIAAKSMGDTRYYAVYAKMDDGSFFCTKTYEYSPKKYALNMLGKASTSENQKKLCVAMLNYGAAAQSYFRYNTDDLMNAELTAEQKAMIMGYDKSLFRGAVSADQQKCGSFVNSGFASRAATVSFDGAFCVNYYFTPSADVVGDMTMYVWTQEAYAAAATLTEDNAAQTKVMVKASDGKYWGQVAGIAAKALDQTYYVTGVYTDASGNRHTTGVIAYSLSKYCMSKAVAGNAMEELAAATAMYGYYAAVYFGTNVPVNTDPVLTVGSLTAAPGANAELTVTIGNNPGVAGMTLSAVYDDSVLTLTKVTGKEALAGLTFQKPKTYKNGCNLVWYGAEPREIVDGNAFVLTFTVAADAAPGTYPVTLVYSSGYDSKLNSVEIQVVGGSIVVSG